jgi:hypothetical protein
MYGKLWVLEETMENNLRKEDAEAIVRLILSQSNALNNFIEDRKEIRSSDEIEFLKKIVGRLMGAIYFEVIEVINEKHKDIMDNVYRPMSEIKFEFPKKR